MKKCLFVAMIAACGGSSGGVDPGLLVVDMTPGEVTDECTYLFDTYPSMSVVCDANNTTTVGEMSISACEDSYDNTISDAPDCTVTVGQAEDCLADFYDAPCASSLPASCGPLFSSACATSSSRKLVEAKLQRSIASR